MLIKTGGKTIAVAGTAERLADGPRGRLARLDIIALGTNTDAVYLGDENVSATRGWPLAVVNSIGTIFTAFDVDPYEIWLDAAADGEGVSWGGIKE